MGDRHESDQISYVYLRLASGVRHSQVDFDELENLAADSALHNDDRDRSVYFFALPEDIEPSDANKIISTLVTKPYVDEAWTNRKNGQPVQQGEAVITPVP